MCRVLLLQLSEEQLEHSGWLQFFLYQSLYCADVEKPRAEEAMKRAVPFALQKALHMRWLDSILVNAQPQASLFCDAMPKHARTPVSGSHQAVAPEECGF